MDPMNEFDVRDAFDAMDHEKMGRISIESFRIIYLGLGYPRSGYGNLREEVSKMQDNVDDGISFMTVKTILTKVCQVNAGAIRFVNQTVRTHIHHYFLFSVVSVPKRSKSRNIQGF